MSKVEFTLDSSIHRGVQKAEITNENTILHSFQI